MYSVSDSPRGAYLDNTDSTLELISPLNFAQRSDCSLVWYLRYATEPEYDYFAMEMRSSPASPWRELQRVTGASSGSFHVFFVDLGAFEGSSDVRLRLRFTSDSSIVDGGVEVDEVYVHCDK